MRSYIPTRELSTSGKEGRFASSTYIHVNKFMRVFMFNIRVTVCIADIMPQHVQSGLCLQLQTYGRLNTERARERAYLNLPV